MAFDPNNYSLKYYKEFKNERGEDVRLEIHQKGVALSSPYPMVIGDLCGLNLTIDGRAESIDTPIVKTTLTFSVVDTADEGDEYVAADDYYIKHGNWQEFYTPDATKYLVKVEVDNGGFGGASWSGFITPDSWEESLSYRGIITITARDNIGALSELPFDMAPDTDGMIKVRDFLDAAFAKVDIPMEIYNAVDSSRYDYVLQDENGNSPLDLLMNRSAFEEDMTWYEALENVLNSLGLALRYDSEDAWALVPMRYIPRLNFSEDDGDLEDLECEIRFHSGNKILDPAYKTIEERIRFGYVNDIDFNSDDAQISFISDQYPTYHMMHIYYRGTSQFQYLAMDAGLHASTDSGNDKAWDTDGSLPAFLDVSRYEIDDDSFNLEGDDTKKYIFVAANSTSDNLRQPKFRKKMSSTQCKLSLELAENPATVFNTTATNDWSGATAKLRIMTNYRLAELTYLIWYESPGGGYIKRWWNGYSWQASPADAEITKTWQVFTTAASSIEENLSECEDIHNGYLCFQIINVEYRLYYAPTSTDELSKCRGVFARIKGVRFDSVNKRNIGSHITTTNNELNTACNVRLERNPHFGFLPQKIGMLFPDNYKYAFFHKRNGIIEQAPYQWRWKATEALQPFPVLVAKQILCYHATSEAILEGDFSQVVEYKGVGTHYIFMYKGTGYIFQGGTIDFRTGRFSATLRGFQIYEDLFNN